MKLTQFLRSEATMASLDVLWSDFLNVADCFQYKNAFPNLSACLQNSTLSPCNWIWDFYMYSVVLDGCQMLSPQNTCDPSQDTFNNDASNPSKFSISKLTVVISLSFLPLLPSISHFSSATRKLYEYTVILLTSSYPEIRLTILQIIRSCGHMMQSRQQYLWQANMQGTRHMES